MLSTVTETGTRERKWRDVGVLCLYVGLFVWLRYWSGLWQNRWVGFVLGGLFAASVLFSWSAKQENVARRYGIPKRAYLVGSVAFVIMGVRTRKHFFQGGTSDDGLIALVLLATAIGEACIYYRLLKESALSSEGQQN